MVKQLRSCAINVEGHVQLCASFVGNVWVYLCAVVTNGCIPFQCISAEDDGNSVKQMDRMVQDENNSKTEESYLNKNPKMERAEKEEFIY